MSAQAPAEPQYTLRRWGQDGLPVQTWTYPTLADARRARTRQLRRLRLRGQATAQLNIQHPCGRVTR